MQKLLEYGTVERRNKHFAPQCLSVPNCCPKNLYIYRNCTDNCTTSVWRNGMLSGWISDQEIVDFSTVYIHNLSLKKNSTLKQLEKKIRSQLYKRAFCKLTLAALGKKMSCFPQFWHGDIWQILVTITRNNLGSGLSDQTQLYVSKLYL